MDKVLEIAKELKIELDKLPLFREYKRMKELMDSSSEIEELKRKIALAKVRGNEQEHKTLLEEYNNYPLIVNYEALKNEVYDYLKQISEIVNKKWLKFTSFFL